MTSQEIPAELPDTEPGAEPATDAVTEHAPASVAARPELKLILEAALLAAGEPLSITRLIGLFEPKEAPAPADIQKALDELAADLQGRGIELGEVASGFRLKTRTELMPWVSRLWEEKPQRYSRALLETLSLIAYRQPITRGEIEEVRGVAVSSNIIRTLQEREWIRVVGHRDVPGKPALFGTTRAFLDYFDLTSLDDLPTLAEIRDMANLEPEFDFETTPAANSSDSEEEGADNGAEAAPGTSSYGEDAQSAQEPAAGVGAADGEVESNDGFDDEPDADLDDEIDEDDDDEVDDSEADDDFGVDVPEDDELDEFDDESEDESDEGHEKSS
jgi:segregation and condensation protein B